MSGLRLPRRLLRLLAMAGAACALQASAQPRPVLIAPGKPILGASQEEWSRRWWQWALSFDDEDSPVADDTGEFCTRGQTGTVWFLAGTYGTRRTERTCHVPQGRTLFFPLINFVTYPAEGERERCASLIARAAKLTQAPAALVLEIDGVRFSGLVAHRQATKSCFRLEEGDPDIGAANGYYVAVAPLPPGVHVLNFGGILPDLSQAVTYTLIVE
jgi:hypothetical protein